MKATTLNFSKGVRTLKTKESIKKAFEKNEKSLSRMGTIGRGSVTTKVNVKDGTTCQIEEGDWSMITDLSESGGGNGEGPNPGVLGRAALGGCLAITYMMYASKMDIPIENLEVELHVDYDVRGMFGFKDVRAGYPEIRYLVKVESPASRQDLLSMLDKADKHSSFLDLFANGTQIARSVELINNN